jgi:thiol-disulfide isomerase/thioredoxin
VDAPRQDSRPLLDSPLAPRAPLAVLAAIALAVLVSGVFAGRRWGQSSPRLADLPPEDAVATVEADMTAHPLAALPAGAESSPGDSAAASDSSGVSYGVITPGQASIGEPAPAFSLAAPEGGRTALTDFSGRPVLVNFFATWCAPCRAEMPYLQAAVGRHAAAELAVVGVDVREAAELVVPYAAELGIDFPIGLDVDGDVTLRYRVRTMPTSFLVARDGTLARIRTGAFANPADLDAELAYILPE